MALIAILAAVFLSNFPKYGEAVGVKNFSSFLYVPDLNYQFDSKKSDETDFKIVPTRPTIFGVSFKREEFTYFFGAEQASEDQDRRSDYLDIQLAIDIDRFLVTTYYQKYGGFFVDNANTININDQQNISTESYGLNLRYFTRKQIDLGKTILSDKKERLSGWSPFHALVINRTQLNNDSEIFNRDNFEQFSGLTKFDLTNLGYEYGLAGTIRYSKFHLTGLGSLGAHRYWETLTKDKNDSHESFGLIASFFIDLGLYNTETMTVGIFHKRASIQYEYQDVEMIQTRMSTTFYYRYFF